MTPKFLYFDLGNVLFFFSHERVCRQVSAVSSVPVGDVSAFIENGDFMVRLEVGAISIKDIYDEFCQVFGVSPPLPDIEHAVSDIFELNASILPLITKLVQSNRSLGILSNTSDVHWEFLTARYMILNEFFSPTALSYQLAVAKPEREIYDASAKLAGVNPAEIFFTDDRQENVDAAIAAGWQAVLFLDSQQLGEELRSRGVEF